MRRENEKKRKLERNRRLGVTVGIILLAAVAGGILLIRLMGGRSDEGKTREGIQYLESMEEKDAVTIEEKIKSIRKTERKEALASGDLTVWEQFDDYAIMGDSRTMGFDQYGFLPSERILAHGGATIQDIPDYMERLSSLNPSYVFLCYGLNDVSIGYWDTPEEYATDLGNAVESIKEQLPDAQVYVNSILPAQDPAFEQSEKWREIPDYNGVVKTYCEEKQYPYIDNGQIVQDHLDLYDADGIHFQEDFYEYWAINMLAEVDAQ